MLLLLKGIMHCEWGEIAEGGLFGQNPFAQNLLTTG